MNDYKVILLLEPPDLIYWGVDVIIGSSMDLNSNYINGFPKLVADYNCIPDKAIYDNGFYPPVRKDTDGFTPLKYLNKYHRFFTIKVRVVKKYGKIL